MKTPGIAAWLRCLMLACAALFPAFAVAEDLEALNIELPEPFFGGTPIPYFSKNLEPKSFKKPPPFMAPKGTAQIARDATVTASVAPTIGTLKQITDGDKSYEKKSVVELPAGLQWIQVDLAAEKSLYAIALWHWHAGDRVYADVVVQASDDPEFKKDVTTLYNNDLDNSSGLGVGPDNEYFETNVGRTIDAKGIKARYVRLYSNGNDANENNNYIEVEVWGK